MSKYAGIKNGRIYIISDHYFSSNNDVIELPKELENKNIEELITGYRFRNNELIDCNKTKTAYKLKVAFITNWKMKCGISTYAEKLFPEIFPYLGDYKVFTEYNDQPTSKEDNKNIVSCWKRGESLNLLIKNIKEYNPDIVLINHEFGIFPNARYWLSFMMQISEFRTITIMHSVFPNHLDKSIVENSIPEIITHLDGGKEALIKKGYGGKVFVIPHGCDNLDETKLWNFYKSEHTFIQAGFCFEYKGWEKSLETVAILKNKYPDVFFTGLTSFSQFNLAAHEAYYNSLLSKIYSLGIEENVALLKGYQSDISLNNYFRTNKCAIFPYVSSVEHEVFGASGAARVAMSKGMPVITSNVNHFSDLPTVKADTPEQMAAALDLLFSNETMRKEQIDRQNKYVIENSWKNVALKYIQILENP